MTEIPDQAGGDNAEPLNAEPLTEDLWDIDKVSSFLGVPKGTLYQWRHHGTGPVSYRAGGGLRYDPVDVRAYLKKTAKGEAA